MTAALASPTPYAEPRATRPALRVLVRPAPPREPPFDDEVADAPSPGRYDQRLPFDPPTAVRPIALVPAARPRGVPDPALWARRLLVGLIETADGRRPLQQLAGMLSRSVGQGLGADFDRAAVAGVPHWLHRGSVHSVRGGEPAEGVAELCATLAVGPRVRAVALRLEVQGGRWQCTRLQLG